MPRGCAGFTKRHIEPKVTCSLEGMKFHEKYFVKSSQVFHKKQTQLTYNTIESDFVEDMWKTLTLVYLLTFALKMFSITYFFWSSLKGTFVVLMFESEYLHT